MKLILAADMEGCPNRCRHCWLGHMPNKSLGDNLDEYMVGYFKPYFDEIAFYSWLREPDYNVNFKERFKRDVKLSINCVPQRYELASFYVLVRNPDYVKFLKETKTQTVQLTFFGLWELTDKYTGRKGAFQELLKATDILLNNKISVRWQAFINKENKNDVVGLLDLISELKLKERCSSFGKEFKFIVHCGSCDGENRRLYDIRLDKGEIPTELVPYYAFNFDDVFEEGQLCEMLKDDESYMDFTKSDRIVLNVSNQLDVYFNYTHMTDKWKIGNIVTESAEKIMQKITHDDVPAIHIAKGITVGGLVAKCGDFSSKKAFTKGDYKMYLLNKYVEMG